MFGYVRPLKGELRVREYEDYRAVYCGLCRAMRRRMGFFAGFAVNYDFTFMAMLMSGESACRTELCRCAAHPFTKRPCACGGEAMDEAADYSVILFWHRLRDGLRDEPFLGRIKYAVASLFLRGAYVKARRARPGFDRRVAGALQRLSELETEKSASLDRMADCFAGILAAIAEGIPEDGPRRAARELLYHLGRVIYILDAADDLAEDFSKGRPNPLTERFGLARGELDPEQRRTVENTASHSINLMSSAWQLMERGGRADIIDNIIYLGVPTALSQVLNGTWLRREKTRKGLE